MDTIDGLGLMEKRLDEIDTMIRIFSSERTRLLKRISNLKQQEITKKQQYL